MSSLSSPSSAVTAPTDSSTRSIASIEGAKGSVHGTSEADESVSDRMPPRPARWLRADLRDGRDRGIDGTERDERDVGPGHGVVGDRALDRERLLHVGTRAGSDRRRQGPLPLQRVDGGGDVGHLLGGAGRPIGIVSLTAALDRLRYGDGEQQSEGHCDDGDESRPHVQLAQQSTSFRHGRDAATTPVPPGDRPGTPPP